MDTLTSFLADHPLPDTVRAILDASPQQWLPYALSLAVGYPLLTSSLRYRRLRKLHQQYNYPTRESMSKMTDEEAFQIQKAVAQLEFPFMFIKSLQFALFRVRTVHFPGQGTSLNYTRHTASRPSPTS